MVVRIRLARFGNKHQPFYNIVVAQARYVAPLLWTGLDLDYPDLCWKEGDNLECEK